MSPPPGFITCEGTQEYRLLMLWRQEKTNQHFTDSKKWKYRCNCSLQSWANRSSRYYAYRFINIQPLFLYFVFLWIYT